MLKSLSSSKVILLCASLVAISLVSGAVYLKANREKVNPGEAYRPKAEEGAGTPASPAVSPPSNPSSPPVRPTPEQTENMVVSEPAQGSKVTDGTIVKGRARVFEGRVAYRLKSTRRGVITQGHTTVTGESSTLSPFAFELGFETAPDTGDSGVLEVFSNSPQDGSEINKVIISVVF